LPPLGAVRLVRSRGFAALGLAFGLKTAC
jgi:hypothetical protein